MANPDPKTDHLKATQWQPGQSGNQGNKGPRLSTRIAKWLDDHAEDEEALMTALIALGTGKRRLLNDDQEEGGKRKPDLDWFKELRELVQGKPTERQEVTTTDKPQVKQVNVPVKNDESSDTGSGAAGGPPMGADGV